MRQKGIGTFIIALMLFGVLPIFLPSASSQGTDGVLLIPLYIYPGCQWEELIRLKSDHPGVNIVVIANPSNGPGSGENGDYDSYIQKLRDSGIDVLGYVYTSYGTRDEAEVKTDIDRWLEWYNVTGIFFDEVSTNAGDEGYYQSLVTYLKDKGAYLAFGNPGTFDSDTVSDYASIFDVLVIYEVEDWPSGNWYPNGVDRSKLAAFAYGIPSFDENNFNSMLAQVEYIYITDDGSPNPWDSLASYFIDEVVSITGEEKTDYVLHVYSSDSTSYSVAEHYVTYDLSSGPYNLTYVSTLRNWEENSGFVDPMYVVVNESGSEKALYFAWGNGWNGTTLYACYGSDCADTDYTDFNATWHALAIEVGSDYAKFYVDGTLLRTVNGLSISEVLRMHAGSYAQTAVYDLYIDNITEVRGKEVQKESFDDNYDCFFKTHVGNIELVSIQQVPFFHSVLVVAGLLILVVVGVGRR